jgi:hypothetical protein
VYFQFGTLLNKRRFLYNFYCLHLLTIFREQLIAASEATFAQKIAFNVFGYGVVLETVIFDVV